MKKFFLWFAAGIVCLVLVYRHFKPDTFFSDLGLNVPQSAIISHQWIWWYLDSEDHLLVLNIPSAQWPQTLAQFKATRLHLKKAISIPTLDQNAPMQRWLAGLRYSDKTPDLKKYYPSFVSGYESFFPAHPAKATAGEFWLNDRRGRKYRCRFLRDETTGQVWFVGTMFYNY